MWPYPPCIPAVPGEPQNAWNEPPPSWRSILKGFVFWIDPGYYLFLLLLFSSRDHLLQLYEFMILF